MTTITPEEITQFRSELTDYPDAIAALDVIQQCEGHLEDAITLLMIGETGKEPERGLDELVEKCRKVICQQEFREDLAVGLIAAVVEPLATSAVIPPGIATAVAVYAFKIGVKKFCQLYDS